MNGDKGQTDILSAEHKVVVNPFLECWAARQKNEFIARTGNLSIKAACSVSVAVERCMNGQINVAVLEKTLGPYFQLFINRMNLSAEIAKADAQKSGASQLRIREAVTDAKRAEIMLLMTNFTRRHVWDFNIFIDTLKTIAEHRWWWPISASGKPVNAYTLPLDKISAMGVTEAIKSLGEINDTVRVPSRCPDLPRLWNMTNLRTTAFTKTLYTYECGAEDFFLRYSKRN